MYLFCWIILFIIIVIQIKKATLVFYQNVFIFVRKAYVYIDPHFPCYMQILIYCRSSVSPYHQWPATQKLFTLDVMYIHDKPKSKNCPQKVYDALVDVLEQVSEYEGYILESEHGLPRKLFRYMCVLLSHPQQRCIQDDINIPKPLRKKSAAVDTTACGEIIPVSGQELSMLIVNILLFWHTRHDL